MDNALAAQVVGTVGYGLLVLATFARTRPRFLSLDILGLLPVAGHYLMLGSAAGAALSLFYIAMDSVAAFAERRLARLAYWFFYPAAGLLGWWFWSGPADLLAIAGSVCAVASRQQTQIWRIQSLIVISTIGWGTFGLAVGSLAQVAFSSVYGAAAAVNAVRFFKQRSTTMEHRSSQWFHTRD